MSRFRPDGGIAQLVEHDLCKVGVWGSNPHASTTTARASTRATVSDQIFFFSPGLPGIVDNARIVELDTNDNYQAPKVMGGWLGSQRR